MIHKAIKISSGKIQQKATFSAPMEYYALWLFFVISILIFWNNFERDESKIYEGAIHNPRHVKPQTHQTPDTSNLRHIKPQTHLRI